MISPRFYQEHISLVLVLYFLLSCLQVRQLSRMIWFIHHLIVGFNLLKSHDQMEKGSGALPL